VCHAAWAVDDPRHGRRRLGIVDAGALTRSKSFVRPRWGSVSPAWFATALPLACRPAPAGTAGAGAVARVIGSRRRDHDCDALRQAAGHDEGASAAAVVLRDFSASSQRPRSGCRLGPPRCAMLRRRRRIGRASYGAFMLMRCRLSQPDRVKRRARSPCACCSRCGPVFLIALQTLRGGTGCPAIR